MSTDTHEGLVGADWLQSEYPARISAETWNGWAVPAFTREVAAQIVDEMMTLDEGDRGYQTLSWHTEDGVDFIHIHDTSADVVEFVAPDADGLYPLGAYSWTWIAIDDVSNETEIDDDMGDVIDRLDESTSWEREQNVGLIREPITVIRSQHTLILSDDELRLLWLGTETLREANPDDETAQTLDRKVSALIDPEDLETRR